MNRSTLKTLPLALALCALAACAHTAPPAATPAASAAVQAPPVQPRPHEGERVVAVAERMERNVHEEQLGDTQVVVSNVLALAVVAPERFDTLLFVHMKGHPRIDGRPLLLGDRVAFVLPVNWRNRDLALEELAGLVFAE